MNLIQYRDAHMRDPVWFWVIKQVRISPIYPTREEAEKWDGTPIELT